MSSSSNDNDPFIDELDDHEDDTFKVPNNEVRLIPTANNVHVKKDADTGMFSILPSGELSEDTLTSEKPFIVFDDEQNIKGRLKNANKDTYSFLIGIGWANGEKLSLFVMKNGIIEYRDNIGKPIGNADNYISGRPPTYMTTFASVGIPKAIYDFVKHGCEGAGLRIVKAEKDVEVGEYIFMNANITNNYIVPVLIRSEDGNTISLASKTHNLTSTLSKVKHNIIGDLGVELKLKRTPNFETDKSYFIAPFLKVFKLEDKTNIRSPGINNLVTFQGSGKATSKSILDLLNKKPKVQASTATAIPKNTPNKTGAKAKAKAKDTIPDDDDDDGEEQ